MDCIGLKKVTLNMKTANGMVMGKSGIAAFSLIEVMVSVLVVMIMFASLYLGFAQGFGVVQLARENLRSTQVMEEKTETLRLYTWEQVNTPGFIPTNFTAPFYAVGAQTNAGFTYYGTLFISPAPLESEAYKDDLRLVTVDVVWTNGNTARHRRMETFVAKQGMQGYIYY